MLATSARVSPHIAIMEAGWTPIDADIIAHKLRLLEQLKLQPKDTYQRHIVTQRMAQVQQGCTKGLCYEAQQLWNEMGRPDQFTDIPTGKITRQKKDLIREGSILIAENRQREWLTEHGGKRNGYYALLYQGGKAKHLRNGTRKEIALMATVRAGAAILRGNKAADKKATKEETECTECDMHKKEDEPHIMTQCTYGPWAKARATCENRIKRAWTKEQWEEYTKMKPRMKTLTLLGLPFDNPELRQSEEAWDERDKATKHMLLTINSHRMTRLGRTSMTDIALHQRTGQEWITIIANKARELKEQQQDMDREQRQARRSELEEMRKTQRKQQREDDRDDQLLQQIQERQEALSIKRANQRDPFGEATS